METFEHEMHHRRLRPMLRPPSIHYGHIDPRNVPFRATDHHPTYRRLEELMEERRANSTILSMPASTLALSLSGKLTSSELRHVVVARS